MSIKRIVIPNAPAIFQLTEDLPAGTVIYVDEDGVPCIAEGTGLAAPVAKAGTNRPRRSDPSVVDTQADGFQRCRFLGAPTAGSQQAYVLTACSIVTAGSSEHIFTSQSVLELASRTKLKVNDTTLNYHLDQLWKKGCLWRRPHPDNRGTLQFRLHAVDAARKLREQHGQLPAKAAE